MSVDLTSLFSITHGLYVLGVKNGENFGGCVVDAFMQSTAEPVGVILCSMHRNTTNQLIKDAGEFSISILDAECDMQTVYAFGLNSSRNVNKWDYVRHNVQDGLPYLDDACAYLKCKVVSAVELSTHTAFFCEVVTAKRGNKKTPMLYGDYFKRKPSVPVKPLQKPTEQAAQPKVKYVCKVCGYVYDGNIPFEDLPDDYRCPICGVSKEDFERVEE